MEFVRMRSLVKRYFQNVMDFDISFLIANIYILVLKCAIFHLK